MRFHKYLLVIFSFALTCSYCQISNFIYDLTNRETNGVDIKKLYSLIHFEQQKNIFFLSEIDHRFKSLDTLRADLLREIITNNKPDKIFYENTWEHDRLLKDFVSNKLEINSFKQCMNSKYYEKQMVIPDSMYFPYWLDINYEFESISRDNYLYLINTIKSCNYLNNFIGIDIGTQTNFIGLFNLLKLSKIENRFQNILINNFLDSIRVRYACDFSRQNYKITDDSNTFIRKKNSIGKFYDGIRSQFRDSELVKSWSSIFSIYNQNNLFNRREDVKTNKYDYYNRIDGDNFRDSILFDNFTFYKPNKWQNLVFLFSTYHLIDFQNINIENSKFCKKIFNLSYWLSLDSTLNNHFRRIAFICFNKGTKFNSDFYDEKNQRKSIEYILSKKYEYAYLDLRKYRLSSHNNIPFFMRPTFDKYLEFNWENIFDGIVFVKNCGCN